MKKFLVGSRAFFSGYKDFNSKDKDYLIIEDSPRSYKWRKEQTLRGTCLFYYARQPVSEMIRRTLESGEALCVGKFLVPEVMNALGGTVADILPLESLLLSLDEKHGYIAEIFHAVKENGSFELTYDQRKCAYETYKQARNNGKSV